MLRAYLKATDFCRDDPAAAARQIVDRGFTTSYEYALQTLQEVPYNVWRVNDPEDTLRFYALRLREVGMIKSAPNKLIAGRLTGAFSTSSSASFPFQLPRTLLIKVEGCDGDANAFYEYDVITVCYEYIDQLWKDIPLKPTPASVTAVDAPVGPLFDTCLHEFAHAMFDMLQLPVLGRE